MSTRHDAIRLAALSTVAFGVFAAARAEPPEVSHAVAVRYSHTALNAEDGAQAMYTRLRNAAERACGSYERKDLAERRRFKECYDTALADALEQIDSQRVAALHR